MNDQFRLDKSAPVNSGMGEPMQCPLAMHRSDMGIVNDHLMNGTQKHNAKIDIREGLSDGAKEYV